MEINHNLLLLLYVYPFLKPLRPRISAASSFIASCHPERTFSRTSKRLEYGFISIREVPVQYINILYPQDIVLHR